MTGKDRAALGEETARDGHECCDTKQEGVPEPQHLRKVNTVLRHRRIR